MPASRGAASPAPGSSSPPRPGAGDPDLERALANPRTRLGRYVVVGELGRGGMGVVFRGHDPTLRRDVAIKMVLEAHASAGRLERFAREARAAARLRHPGIIAVHEVGQDDRGRPYIVMDFVAGGTLADAVDGPGGSGPLPPRRAAEMVREVALALEHAHDHGILHRDVKPQNILIDAQTGRAHLTDFGLAREIDGVDRSLTLTGQLLGTPHYCSPEQIRGEQDAVGPRADVFAAGAVLYFALAGEPPFEGESVVEVIGKTIRGDVVPLRRRSANVHVDLETIAFACLESDPERRYPTAGALAADLGRFLAGEPISARPVGRRERVLRWARRNRAFAASLVASAILIAGLLVASGAFAIYSIRKTRRALDEARDARALSDRRRLEAESALARAEAEGERARAAEARASAEARATRRELARALLERGERLLVERRLPEAWAVLAASLALHDDPRARGRIARLREGAPRVRFETPRRALTPRPGASFQPARVHRPIGLIASSPDGRVVVTASDGAPDARVFGVGFGEPRGAIAPSGGSGVAAIGFLADGRLVLGSSGPGGGVEMLTLAPEESGDLAVVERRAVAGPFSAESTLRIGTLAPDGSALVFERRVAPERGSGSRAGRGMWAPTSVERLDLLGGGSASVFTGSEGSPLPMRVDVQPRPSTPAGALVAASSEARVVVIEPETGRQAYEFQMYDSPGGSRQILTAPVAWRPDGRALAFGDEGRLRLHELAEARASGGRSDRELLGGSEREHIASLAWSDDGRRIAIGRIDGVVDVADVTPTGAKSVLRLAGHGTDVDAVAILEGGHTLAALSGGALRLWDLALSRTPMVADGYAGDGGVLWSRTGAGDALIALTLDHELGAWSLSGEFDHPRVIGPRVSTFGARVRDGVVVVGGRSGLAVIDVGSGRQLASGVAHDSPLVGIALAPDGERVATAGSGRVVIWRRVGQRLEQVHAFTVGPPDDEARSLLPLPRSVSWSPDGELLATGGPAGAALWNPATGERVAELASDPRDHSVHFAPREPIVAVATPVGLAVVDVTESEQRFHIELAGGARAVTWSDDGERIAFAVGDSEVRLIDAAGRGLITLDGSSVGRIRGLAFSPDGRAIAIGGTLGVIEVQDLAVLARSPEELLEEATVATRLRYEGDAILEVPGPR